MNNLSKPSTILCALLIASCGGSPEPASGGDAGPSSEGAVAAGMPAALWSATPIADPKEVRDLRAKGKDGEAVVVRGTLQDFGELSTFRLVDDALLDCTEMGEKDHCATPWDFCCADPDELQEFTVNVEFLEEGLPGDWSLSGQNGLDRLSEVIVAGTLRKDEAGNLRVEATRMSLQ